MQRESGKRSSNRQRWEAQRERWRREEEARRAAKALKDGNEELLQLIDLVGGEATRGVLRGRRTPRAGFT